MLVYLRGEAIMRHAAYFVLTGLPAVIFAPVSARVSPVTDKAGSQLITDVTACRSIANSAARLACYDGSVAKLADASDKKDVVVLDRAEVQKTKRSLFGFDLPRLPFFDNAGDSKDKKASDEFAQIEARITSASPERHRRLDPRSRRRQRVANH